MPEPLRTEQLLALYKIAIEEYRFEVRLNWDRTAYYLTLNSGLIAIAVGLLKVGSAPVLNLFVAGVFFFGFLAAIIGIKNIQMGHNYYRRTIVKKSLVEDQLGLTTPLEGYSSRQTLTVGTTLGQDERVQMLNDTDKWLKRPLRRITRWTIVILFLFCMADGLGILGSLWLYGHPASISQPPRVIELVPFCTDTLLNFPNASIADLRTPV